VEGKESVQERKQSQEDETSGKVRRSSQVDKTREKVEVEKDVVKSSSHVDTPAKSFLPEAEKRKQMSSLKKIKVYLILCFFVFNMHEIKYYLHVSFATLRICHGDQV